jgi:ABC-type multidrug transport system fused ATPase/permease subunit
VGDLRYQLDPFQQFDDAAIWDVLGKVNMTAAVKEMPRALQEPIAENGENLSQGQKQLLCIARAFLRNAKILVMV